MDSPLIQKQTKKQIDNFISSPSNSLLLVGQGGSGKSTIAHYICSRVLGDAKIMAGSNFLLVEPIEGLISIESIRSIGSFIKLKSTGSGSFNRCIIIDSSEKMNVAAQNTLLKTLEEPPEGTLIILCVDSLQSLLPTILSRLSVIDIRKVPKSDLTEYFINKGYSEKEVTLAVLVSDGRIGMVNSILSNKADINLSVLKSAKEIIGMSKNDRLIKINTLSKQERSDLISLVDGLINIARASLNASADRDNSKSIATWNKVLSESLSAKQGLMVNGSKKLVLTKLFLAI